MKFPIVVTTLVGLTLALPVSLQDMAAPTFVVGDRWPYSETDLLTKLETGQLRR